MKKLTILIALLLSLQLMAESQHGVIYVVPDGNGTGSSWTDALGDIQEAINLARSQDPMARKDVWVAAGTYEISTAININDSVNVYGSFAGNETAVSERPRPENARAWEFSHPTILNGNESRLMQSGGHLDMETIIDGFIMQNGNATGTVLNSSGGAVVARGNVVYQNCIMRNNSATGAGGAAIMTGGTIRHCLIENNTHTTGANGGGGIFSNAPAGQPSYIEHCVVRNNTSTIRGAGIGVQGVEMSYVSNVEIYNNSAIDGTTMKAGGGIFANSSNNRIMNSLIYHNTGITALYYNGGTLLNNTIVKNVGGIYLAGNVITATNNIVWGCATDITGETPTSISGVANTLWNVNYNATYNPLPTDKGWAMEGNIEFSSNNTNGDVPEPKAGTVGSGPKFIKISNFIGTALTDEQQLSLDSVNWELTTLSPCVNAGTEVAVVIEDFAGTNRPQGFPAEEALYDIGAYELPYFTVVAGEAESANGFIYSGMGELLPEGYQHGYAKGSMLELYFEPATGYKIGKAYYMKSTDGGMTFTGEQVEFTDELDEDLFWSTTVNSSFKVQVDWESITSTNPLDASIILCYSTREGIHIQGTSTGDCIRIYNTAGMIVHEQTAAGQQHFIPLQGGLYIVHLSEGVQKVLVH